MGAGFIRAGCAVIARTSCKATTRHQVQGTNRERTSSGVPRLHDGHPQAERPPRITRSIDRREAMSAETVTAPKWMRDDPRGSST